MNDLTLLLGDCLETMKGLPDNSVDAIVTDPPYGLGFMGKHWDHGVPGVEFWREMLRIMKPGAHLAAFSGTRTYHRMAVAIEDAGFQVRDMLAWVYGSGFPKSWNLEGEKRGWGTALKPAQEPICIARKPLIGTVAQNVQKWGTGALNIDGCRIKDGTETYAEKPEYFANYNNKCYGNGMGGGNYENTGGRWPANLIHDGSHEATAVFPSDEARFFYCAKVGRQERDAGVDALTPRTWKEQVCRDNDSGHLSPRAGAGRTSAMRNHHPTVKPVALMRWLCRLITPPGGTVLDPFMGSGTTGIAARVEGFRFIGCEREPEYMEIARLRIQHWNPADETEPAPTGDNKKLQLALFG